MQIRTVRIEEIDQVISLLGEVIADMRAKGIDQWDEIYPPHSMLAGDIAQGTLFGCFDQDLFCGMLVLNETQSPEYNTVDWQFKDKPLIVHRVCTKPTLLKKGIATKMMLFAENFAQTKKYGSIRLDAFIENPTSVNFYRSLNYKEVGQVNFRKGKFYCFEKKILSKIL